MIKKELLSEILGEEVMHIAGSDVEDMLDKILPTNEEIVYITLRSPTAKTAKSNTISAHKVAQMCLLYAFNNGYKIEPIIEDAMSFKDYDIQYRNNVTPTPYASKAFISENAWDGIFYATEFIIAEIKEKAIEAKAS